MKAYGNVFQGNLGRQSSGLGPMRPGTGYAQPIQEPSQGTPYGMPRKSDDSGFYRGGPRIADETEFNYQNPRQPPQWNMGDDIRRPPSNPARPPMPPAPQPGRLMAGPGSGYGYGNDTYYLPHSGTGGGMPPPQRNPYVDQGGQATAGPYGGFPAYPTNPPPVTFRPGQANPIQQPAEESPEEYRRSIAAERARAAKMDAEAAAKRQKAQQNRPTYEVPGYSGRVTDPMVAQNEYDRIAREERAAARGDKPRKTQMELDMEARQQEHQRILQQRAAAQNSLPGVDEATQRAVRQRMSAYGETPEQAFQNGGFAAQQAYARSRMADGPTARTPAGQSRWR